MERKAEVSSGSGSGAGKSSASHPSKETQSIGSAKTELAGLELQRSLLGTDGLHRLMFSTLMLYKWRQAGHQMTLNEWVQINTGIEGGGNDVPMHVQTSIYRAVSEGHAVLTDKSSTAKLALAPTIAGFANVHYSGRAQVTHDGDPAAWPEASPRLLAAQGGVSSAGRFAEGMYEEDEPESSVDTGLAVLRQHAAVQKSRSKGSAAQKGGPQNPKAASILAQPFDADEPDPRREEEVAWLSLHQWMLLLSSDTADNASSTPYAFVSLRHAVLKEVDATSRRLVLASHSDTGWPHTTAGEEDWLELCLLLGDGRFQPLEAPQLELRLDKAADFDAWAAHLGELCYDDSSLRQPGNKPADLKIPAFLNSNWPEEPSALQVPPMIPGDNTS